MTSTYFRINIVRKLCARGYVHTHRCALDLVNNLSNSALMRQFELITAAGARHAHAARCARNAHTIWLRRGPTRSRNRAPQSEFRIARVRVAMRVRAVRQRRRQQAAGSSPACTCAYRRCVLFARAIVHLGCVCVCMHLQYILFARKQYIQKFDSRTRAQRECVYVRVCVSARASARARPEKQYPM